MIESGNLNDREYIWKTAFNAFIDSGKLLFGIGHNAFKNLMYNTVGIRSAGHNTYLITLIELGLIGFVLYIRILFYLARKVLILVKRDSLFFSLLLIPLLLSMFTLGLQNRRWLILIGIIIIKLVDFGNSKAKRILN